MLFPHEEKPAEHAVLMEIAATEQKVMSVGFAHVVHNHGLLHFRNHQSRLANPPRPTEIATTGPDAQDFLVDNFGLPIDMLPVIGSPKYVEPVARSFKEKRFIFMMSDHTEIMTLLRFLREDFPFYSDLSLAIKPYPFAHQRSQAKAIHEIKQNLPNVKLFTGSLDEALNWANITVFNSSSAGVEAILSGAVGVWANFDPVIRRSAIADRELENFVTQCWTGSQLKAEMLRLAKMNWAELEYIFRHQVTAAERILSKCQQASIQSTLSVD